MGEMREILEEEKRSRKRSSCMIVRMVIIDMVVLDRKSRIIENSIIII